MFTLDLTVRKQTYADLGIFACPLQGCQSHENKNKNKNTKAEDGPGLQRTTETDSVTPHTTVSWTLDTKRIK